MATTKTTQKTNRRAMLIMTPTATITHEEFTRIRANFYSDDGRPYLVRCPVCGDESGRENWSRAVESGECAWCGAKAGPRP
jgi:hypothetical protein